MFNWNHRSYFTEVVCWSVHLHLSVIIHLNMVFDVLTLSGRQGWRGMSSYYYPALRPWQCSGVSQRLWRKPGGRLRLLALWGASSQDWGSKTSYWTAAIWMEKCWGSKLELFHWVEFLSCTTGLKTRGGCRLPATFWLYYHVDLVPALRFTHHRHLFCFSPHLLLCCSG